MDQILFEIAYSASASAGCIADDRRVGKRPLTGVDDSSSETVVQKQWLLIV